MRFKDWIMSEVGMGGTSMAFGGATLGAQTANNSTMPYGVRSKYVTKDTNEKDDFDKGKVKVDPKTSFGFQRPTNNKPSSDFIDKNRKSVPMRDDLGITY